MAYVSMKAVQAGPIPDAALLGALQESIKGWNLSRVLLLPPDVTRLHSYAGKITAMYYSLLKDTCRVDIMPALGTHEAMTREEALQFFGSGVPFESILTHNWRSDIQKIGEVPSDYVSSVSEGLIDYPIDVEVNRRLLNPAYDLILSIGQVVPHEVAGMANYSKNIFVGCGGKSMIDRTHFLGAVFGMERIMGRDHSPVRKVFDYAEEKYIKNLPLLYVLTVTTVAGGRPNLEGLFIGRDRGLFEEAVILSRQKNINFLDKPLKKVIVYLDEREFRSTWLGNKAIYRTRMAIADGGELIVLAPGVSKFGEDAGIGRLIEKYGYTGRARILDHYRGNLDLQENLSAAAHLIHGSSEGRFTITYAVEKMGREEVEGVGFRYASFSEAVSKFNLWTLQEGFNTLGSGEEVYYVSNPAVGLWAGKSRF